MRTEHFPNADHLLDANAMDVVLNNLNQHDAEQRVVNPIPVFTRIAAHKHKSVFSEQIPTRWRERLRAFGEPFVVCSVVLFLHLLVALHTVQIFRFPLEAAWPDIKNIGLVCEALKTIYFVSMKMMFVSVASIFLWSETSGIHDLEIDAMLSTFGQCSHLVTVVLVIAKGVLFYFLVIIAFYLYIRRYDFFVVKKQKDIELIGTILIFLYLALKMLKVLFATTTDQVLAWEFWKNWGNFVRRKLRQRPHTKEENDEIKAELAAEQQLWQQAFLPHDRGENVVAPPLPRILPRRRNERHEPIL